MVAQGLEDGHRGGEESVLARGGGELLEAGAQDETALHVARDHAVELEGDGQPVGGGPCEARGGNELRECRRAGLKGAEDQRRFVEDSDAARCLLFHAPIFGLN